MPNFKPVVLAALAVVLTSTAAWAASPTPKAGEHRQKRTFETVDTNRDGAVSVDELKTKFANRPRKLAKVDTIFKRIDKNIDGKVDKAEFDAWKAKRAERRQRKHKHK